MNWVFSLYVALLFFLLTPGVLLTLPSKGSKRLIVAAVHTFAFWLLWQLTHKFVWQVTSLHVIMPNIV